MKFSDFLTSNFTLNDAGGGGAVAAAYFPVSFNGSTVFQENRGRTLVVSKLSLPHFCLFIIFLTYLCKLKVVESKIEVYGGLHFIENDGAAIDGGAMYLTSLSQMVLSPGANITFDGNMGM